MRECEKIRESLDAWLDGELDQGAAGALRSHVETCAHCREEKRQLEHLQGALRSVLETEAARVALEPLWNGIERRIATKRGWFEDLSDRLGSALTPPRLAWAVPGLIALALGVWSLDSVLFRWHPGAQKNNFASVESIDTYGRNVALLNEDETKTTVIWLYHNQEGENESSGKTADERPSF
jgi:anti-sigma factor RsiW